MSDLFIRRYREPFQTPLPNACSVGGVVNGWYASKFAKAMADTGRKQSIIAAVTTDICLVFPTTNAMEVGHEVQAVLDARRVKLRDRRGDLTTAHATRPSLLTSTNTMVAELVGN